MSKSTSRQEKLDSIVGEKYPRDFPGRVSVKKVLDIAKNSDLDNIAKYDIKNRIKNKIAGRIIARRDHKQNLFFDLMDQTGTIQLHAKRDKIGEKKNPCLYPQPDGTRCCECDTCQESAFLSCWEDAQDCDLGDMVGVEGTITKGIRSGEPLLLISNWTLLAKALREPPDKFHGLKDPERKYRHRELDLLSSAETRDLFRTRAEIVFEIRKYLNEQDYIEIECPVLQSIYGGATARPFKTRHNALGQDFYLSISSELYLKRAMVGGFDRVYSFSRCFRNEGISPTHNPEFTNLEIFESCKTSTDMESFTAKIIQYLQEKFTADYAYLEFRRNMLSSDWPLSRSFYTNPDQESNLAGKHIADAWEMYCGDMEVASGASDLNDPREQESRLKESENNSTKSVYSDRDQITYTETSDYDPYDPNYIEALECGLLPIAGVGIGIDRLVMLLTGRTNIRETIMFPTLKDEK